MAEIKICSSCKRSISDKEIQSGKVVFQNTKCICQECSHSLGIKKTSSQDQNTFILQSILNDVKNIKRVLTYEKSAWLNIVGAVVQCLVFGILIFAGLNSKDSVLSALMVALIFQVMALTIFVIKK